VARLAVFDLDGTLTRGDTFLQFVAAGLARWPARCWRLPGVVPPLLAFACGLWDRGRLKGALLRCLLGGVRREELEAFAAQFAHRVVSGRLHAQVPGVLARHRDAGDALVLMSASPDIYVPLIGRLLGFERTICTPIRWNADRLDGRLAGPNCRGPVKSQRVMELRREYAGLEVIAYGNTPSDLDHMRGCEAAVYVNARGALRQELQAAGIEVVSWH
jgi:phosphatidylglycerophosphatase C